MDDDLINSNQGGTMADEKKKLKVSLSSIPPPDQVHWRNKNTGDLFEPVPCDLAYLKYDKKRLIYKLRRF
jgi:hypothetical protein